MPPFFVALHILGFRECNLKTEPATFLTATQQLQVTYRKAKGGIACNEIKQLNPVYPTQSPTINKIIYIPNEPREAGIQSRETTRGVAPISAVARDFGSLSVAPERLSCVFETGKVNICGAHIDNM